jgi:hypothetical protein
MGESSEEFSIGETYSESSNSPPFVKDRRLRITVKKKCLFATEREPIFIGECSRLGVFKKKNIIK